MKRTRKKALLKNNIEPLRIERGLSQAALGKKVKSAGQSVSRHESGARDLDVNDLFIYARALGVHPDQIVDMSEFGAKTAACDQTVLGLIIGWLHDAIALEKTRPDSKTMGEWAAFAYKTIIAEDMPFQAMRKYVYDLVKLQSVTKK